jgi:cell division protein FtsI/penicillin-binding protein 2
MTKAIKRAQDRRIPISLAVGASLIVILCQASQLHAQQNLQAHLSFLTAHRHGSAIVIDPSTGGILAAWNLRRATEDAYPPGSTAKIVEAAAALEEGVITPRDRIACRRIPPLLGPAYQCVRPPAPEGFTVSSALANSCNYSFTVQPAAVPGGRVAGKTGTASALDGSGATQAWFVGFAPAEQPEIVLVIFLDRGTGGRGAAPLAGKLFRRYFVAKERGGRASERR